MRVYGYAQGEKGTRAQSKLYFPIDPGYIDTARMLVESGLCLSLEEDIKKVPGGYHTTSSALGNTLLKRLCDTGSTWESKFVEEEKKTN